MCSQTPAVQAKLNKFIRGVSRKSPSLTVINCNFSLVLFLFTDEAILKEKRWTKIRMRHCILLSNRRGKFGGGMSTWLVQEFCISFDMEIFVLCLNLTILWNCQTWFEKSLGIFFFLSNSYSIRFCFPFRFNFKYLRFLMVTDRIKNILTLFQINFFCQGRMIFNNYYNLIWSIWT